MRYLIIQAYIADWMLQRLELIKDTLIFYVDRNI